MRRHSLRTLPCLSLLAAFSIPCGAGPEPAKPRLASTPPMGWNSWEAFRKNFDEASIKAQADAMATLGFRDAGYTYIVIDGGWKTSERDTNGNLIADPKKFPHGIKALADYIHQRGLKFGLHQPAGVKDCGHDEPGSQGNEERDAALFAQWGVDFIKYDQCDYIHDARTTPGAPDLDKIVIRKDDRVIFTIEAEFARNRLDGMARVEDCPACSGGRFVTGIGYGNGAVKVDVRTSDAGRHVLDVHVSYPYYGQNRDHFKQMTFFVGVNGAPPQRVDIPYTIPERYRTGVASIPIELRQGDNVILIEDPSSQEDDVRLSYVKMARALEASGREFMFSTSGAPRPWFWAEPVAHLWRTAGDISNQWTSIMATLDRHADTLRFSRPGFWADPDMLEVGAPAPAPRNGVSRSPMNTVEQQSQFSLWAIMSAPLFISADLRNLQQNAKSILLNREVIAIDQDPLGMACRRIRRDGDLEIFFKRLKNGEAVALLNRSDRAAEIRVTAAELGLAQSAFKLRDLWTAQSQNVTDGVVRASVEPHGVKLFRIQ